MISCVPIEMIEKWINDVVEP